MRNEYLSDFAGENLRRSQQFRMDAASDLERCRDRAHEAGLELQLVRRRKPIWKRVFAIQTVEEREARDQVEEAEWQETRAETRWKQSKPEVEQQAAGVRGEVALVSGLAGLSDDWLVLRGYRNRRGETDVVLVGPSGVWAVEVKNYNAQLTVDGERWFYDRIDNNGRVVETQPAVDGGGRTWARQVGDVADDLAAWLAYNDYPIPVRRAVMMMHERAAITRCQNPGVDLVGTDPGQLLEAIEREAVALDPGACVQIVELIRRDHHQHNG